MTRISLDDDLEDPEKILSDCIKRIKDNKRESLKQELQGKIREAESKKDFKLLKQLQTEFQNLLKK